MAEDVLIGRDRGVLTITINRANRLNAVTHRTLLALGDAVSHIEADDRVIVLRGEGRSFCSGADLDVADDISSVAAAGMDAASRLIGALTASPLPVVAVVQGPCAGVGVSIALAADLVVASTDASFHMSFTRVGLMPDGGATALLSASIGRARAIRMTLLGERIIAADAAAQGLIAAAVPAARLEDEAVRMIEALRSGPAVALAHTKAAVNASALTELHPALAREREGQVRLLNAPDFAEGARAFAARRAPAFTDRP